MVLRRARSICPRVAGTTSGRARATKVRRASPSRRRWTGCPCSCGGAPLRPRGPRANTPRRGPLAPRLDRLPLLLRAGAIVPRGPVVQHTGERPLDEVTLLMYPEGASRFELYEDDGRSNAYRLRGDYALR